jgi:uncharacterized protein
MIYKQFGNTGIYISSLGFGCMRLPMIKVADKEVVDEDKVSEMLLRAYELGVNYFDSAWMYNNGLSEIAMGKAIKGFRQNIYVSTKSPGYLVKKPGDYRQILEQQLKKMDLSSIDFYHFHGISYDDFIQIDNRADWMNEAYRAKEEGLIKHISFSFHDKPENMIKLIDLDLFESVLCQYSVIDRSNEDAMTYARKKGLGVIVMGPLGGGRVAGLPKELTQKLGIKVKSNAELALRFVFANPNIDCALSGMGNINMVEENALISANREPLSPAEVEAINGVMLENEKLSGLYCTGCNYCMPCPQKVNIPEIFRMMNYYRIYHIEDYAREGYAQIGVSPWVPGNRADSCIECGNCEEKCPQKIEIIKQLKESHDYLAKN